EVTRIAGISGTVQAPAGITQYRPRPSAATGERSKAKAAADSVASFVPLRASRSGGQLAFVTRARSIQLSFGANTGRVATTRRHSATGAARAGDLRRPGLRKI